MCSGGEATVIDITSSTKSAAYSMIDELSELKINYVDNYIYSEINGNLSVSVGIIAKNIFVKNFYFPAPKTTSDFDILKNLQYDLSLIGAEINYYETGDIIVTEGFTFKSCYAASDDIAFTVRHKGRDFTYLSSGMLSGNTKTVAAQLLKGCDTLILGSHGQSNGKYSFTFEVDTITELIVSDPSVKIDDDISAYYANKLIKNENLIDLYVK
jgi:hypothetical protein